MKNSKTYECRNCDFYAAGHKEDYRYYDNFCMKYYKELFIHFSRGLEIVPYIKCSNRKKYFKYLKLYDKLREI